MKKLIPYHSEPIGFWRPLLDNPDYEASMDGQIRRLYKKGYTLMTGYKKHNMPHKSIYFFKLHGKERSFHREVYKAFYGPVPDGKIVIHKNGITSDHAPINLALSDFSTVGKTFGRRANGKSVLQYDPDTMEITAVYRSAREASMKNHFCHQVVTDRCNGKVKYASCLDGKEYCWEDDKESYKMMLERIRKGKRSREVKRKRGRPGKKK